jgi:uncharacterized MAPEG superfamily protein
MNVELTQLARVSAFTALLWMPYILNRLAVGKGLVHEVGYPEEPTKLSPWADRLKRAHVNAIENLVVFAALVLVAHAAGASNAVTALAAQAYFWARVGHAVVYALGVPWLRTLTFTVSWMSQMAIAWVVLTHGQAASP